MICGSLRMPRAEVTHGQLAKSPYKGVWIGGTRPKPQIHPQGGSSKPDIPHLMCIGDHLDAVGRARL